MLRAGPQQKLPQRADLPVTVQFSLLGPVRGAVRRNWIWARTNSAQYLHCSWSGPISSSRPMT